jgi:hypothetical protein
MSTIPELEASHINTAGALIKVASDAGAFKLAQFGQVAVAYKECARILKESGEASFKMSEASVNSLVLIHNVIEFAANNNGFKVENYETVTALVAIMGAHLKPHLEEAKKKEEEAKKEEEEAKEEGGVEESKE